MLQELINKLNEAMQSIQNLQVQPTEHNCTQIVSALHAIRDAAQIGVQMEKAISEAGKPVLDIVPDEPEKEAEDVHS